MQSKAQEAASEKVREIGEDPDKYTFQEEDAGDAWRVIVLPRAERIRGGGYEIMVNKKTGEVCDMLYYQ